MDWRAAMISGAISGALLREIVHQWSWRRARRRVRAVMADPVYGPEARRRLGDDWLEGDSS